MSYGFYIVYLSEIILSSNDKTDLDIIRSEHRFLWDEEEDKPDATW